MCIENPDGSYTILINAKMSSERQKEAYLHALDHIENHDFEKDYLSVQQIEAEAHGLVPRTIPKPVATYKGNKEVSEWLKRITSDHRKIKQQFDARWKRNNLRASMGYDFFDSEQKRLDNLTE
jgi:hypothetical protein